MSTKVRTVSDLTELNEKPGNNDLIEISHTVDDEKFSSRKYKYGRLMSDMSSTIINTVSEKWNLAGVDDISKSIDYIDELSSSLKLVDGRVNLNYAPVIINESTTTNDRQLLTKKQVYDMILDHQLYVGSESYIECEPGNDAGWTKDYQYFWKIENGEYDSSLALNEYGMRCNGVYIDKTGYLTIYGWLASSSSVAPQNAWVGLYGLFRDRWILIQVQPWIVGRNAQMLQYVGFNIPVHEGMILKIMTGFPVNGNVTGMHSYNHTLLLSDKGNVVNSFVGYVIES